jgi:hypothetical protein
VVAIALPDSAEPPRLARELVDQAIALTATNELAEEITGDRGESVASSQDADAWHHGTAPMPGWSSNKATGTGSAEPGMGSWLGSAGLRLAARRGWPGPNRSGR